MHAYMHIRATKMEKSICWIARIKLRSVPTDLDPRNSMRATGRAGML